MKALVFGAGGFIGSHLVKRLRSEGYYVVGVDLKHPEYSQSEANEFIIGDLRDPNVVANAIHEDVDEIYQLAAEMGGAGYIFTGENDARVMHNSALINLNTAKYASEAGVKLIFYSSSACIYPKSNQTDPDNPDTREENAYPAEPDSEYGWEKLFSERLYQSFARNENIKVKIARFHNVYGPEGTFAGGKEKAPAAICRKVATSEDTIEIWGDGKQTRSFLYIDDCLDAIRLFMKSEFDGPVNIGSDEMISINEFAQMIIGISGKSIRIANVEGPTGVRGRSSNNDLIQKELGWTPSVSLKEGITRTYNWIKEQTTVKVGN